VECVFYTPVKSPSKEMNKYSDFVTFVSLIVSYVFLDYMKRNTRHSEQLSGPWSTFNQYSFSTDPDRKRKCCDSASGEYP
jgi:hypothetical protein